MEKFLVALIFYSFDAARHAANEPLEDDVVVHRTVDGRVILTSTSSIGACLARAKIYMDELLPHADALHRSAH